MRQHISLVLFLAVCLANCSGAQSDAPAANGSAPISLNGAGSTFDEPLFTSEIPAYKLSHKGVLISYDAVGSGEGARRFLAGGVDFGATDVPIAPADLAHLKGGANAALEFPITVGGVALAYNVPGSPPHLRLSRASIVGIYSGTISYWDDPEILGANSGAHLTHIPILAIHRSDSSGSTFIFTGYLSLASDRWRKKFGRAELIEWPARDALGERGTSAVGARVKRTIGAIGYVALANALSNRLATAAVENRSGRFSVPTRATIRAAAAGIRYPSPENFTLNSEGGAYPIAGFSWVTISMAEPDSARQAALCSLFSWVLTDGQARAGKLGYAELSVNATAKPLDELSKCSG